MLLRPFLLVLCHTGYLQAAMPPGIAEGLSPQSQLRFCCQGPSCRSSHTALWLARNLAKLSHSRNRAAAPWRPATILLLSGWSRYQHISIAGRIMLPAVGSLLCLFTCGALAAGVDRGFTFYVAASACLGTALAVPAARHQRCHARAPGSQIELEVRSACLCSRHIK